MTAPTPRRPARRALLALAACAALTVPAAATTTAAAAAPPAAGQAVAVAAAGAAALTISGTEPGQAFVHLAGPSTITLDVDTSSDQVAVTGAGRAVGAVLERVGDPDTQAVLAAVNFNACPTRGCKPVRAFEFVTGTIATDEQGNRTVPLPAGRYRIVLLADGAPVTVTLRLTGLARSVAVKPTGPAGSTYADVEPGVETPAAPAGRFVYSGGKTYPPTARGALLLYQELYTTTAGSASLTGTCTIFGPPPPSDAYLPGCPTAEPGSDRNEFVVPITVADPQPVLLVGFGNTAAPPDIQTSLGHYLLAALPAKTADVTQIAVPLGPAPAPAAQASPPPTETGGRPEPAAPATAAPAAGSAGRQLPQAGAGPAAAAAALLLAAAAVLRRHRLHAPAHRHG